MSFSLARLGIRLEKRLVAHVERAHELQHGDLQRKIERRDDGHASVRPAVSGAGLARVVARHSEGARQEAHLIAAKVFEEAPRDHNLARGLGVALRCGRSHRGRENRG